MCMQYCEFCNCNKFFFFQIYRSNNADSEIFRNTDTNTISRSHSKILKIFTAILLQARIFLPRNSYLDDVPSV
jgi:hypothetical protein